MSLRLWAVHQGKILGSVWLNTDALRISDAIALTLDGDTVCVYIYKRKTRQYTHSTYVMHIENTCCI